MFKMVDGVYSYLIQSGGKYLCIWRLCVMFRMVDGV